MRPDSYSETSQVNSSCLDASYEHARACSTQSPKRILPLSYFILQLERGYSSNSSSLTSFSCSHSGSQVDICGGRFGSQVNICGSGGGGLCHLWA